VGAEIAPSADAVWAKAEMIMKVKNQSSPSGRGIRKGQVVFTYFHFAASEALTKGDHQVRLHCDRLRTVELPTKELPLLTADE